MAATSLNKYKLRDILFNLIIYNPPICDSKRKSIVISNKRCENRNLYIYSQTGIFIIFVYVQISGRHHFMMIILFFISKSNKIIEIHIHWKILAFFVSLAQKLKYRHNQYKMKAFNSIGVHDSFNRTASLQAYTLIGIWQAESGLIWKFGRQIFTLESRSALLSKVMLKTCNLPYQRKIRRSLFVNEYVCFCQLATN